jgi:uncharacterized membrane protein (DUF485 family)
MTFKKKRRNKKMARLFAWLTWTTLILYAGFITFAIIHAPLMNTSIEAMIVVMGPLIVMVILWFVSMQCSMKRNIYMRSIREWRNKNFFRITLTMILAGEEPSKITPYYGSISRGFLQDFITGMFVHSMYVSEEPRFAEIGRDRVEDLLARHDPDAVKF